MAVRFMSLKFGSDRCRGCKMLPKIQFGIMQGWQNYAKDSVQTVAGAAKRCQKSGHKNAGYAKPCPRFSSYFYQVGISSP